MPFLIHSLFLFILISGPCMFGGCNSSSSLYFLLHSALFFSQSWHWLACLVFIPFFPLFLSYFLHQIGIILACFMLDLLSCSDPSG